MGPRGPCWPLPSLSSWQMKEPKQGSLALSNAPGTLRPDPPTASLRGQSEGQPCLQGQGSQARFSPLGPRGVGGLRQGSSSLDPARPGASVALGGGCPATVAKDIPLREPPPPLPLPPAVPGPRQRKTKTRAEETAAGAPPEKNPDKRHRPPAPAAQPPRSWHCLPGRCPLLWQPRSTRPPAYLPPSHPPAQGSSRSGPLLCHPPAEVP